MKNAKITPELLGIITQLLVGLGGGYAALDALSTARVNDDHNGQRAIESDQLSPAFKRKLQEHQINSNVLRDVLNNYRTSMDLLYNELKTEVLGESPDEDNMHLRPAQPVEEGEVPPAIRVEAWEHFQAERVGNPFRPRAPRPDRIR